MFRGSYERAYDALGRHVRRFVRGWRGADAHLLKPLSDRRGAVWQVLAPAEYPWFIPFLAAILVVGVTAGPRPLSGTPASYGLAALGIALMLAWHAAVLRSPWLRIRLLSGYLAILVILAGLVVWASFRDPSTPLHLGPGVALALTAMLAVASWAAGAIGRRVKGETMQSALPWVELFPSKDRGDYTGDTPGLALVSIGFLVLLRYPVQLLLPPALVALVVPSGSLFWPCLATGVAAWLALVLGVLFDRLMEVMKTVGRLFFIGPQFVLSVVVIAIAVGRWSGSHFINYLFDRPGGNGTVAWYIFFAYAVAWFYGFWCEILLTRRFIRVLARDGARVSQVPYEFHGDERASRVSNAGRTIALHGAGRLMVQGAYDADYRAEQRIGAQTPARTFLTPAELLHEFRTQLEDKGWPPEGEEPSEKDPVVRVRDLQRGVLAFPAISAALVLAFLGTPLVIGSRYASQPPELDIVWDGHVNLPVQRLVLGTGLVRTGRDACRPLGPLEPRIAVAASGGGTRAAIYTAAVLRGLAKQDKICKVVLTSGVSGGSAALAYFALNQHRLRVPFSA
ncbi:MAG TPA: hypothetical protein VEW03_08290, partial [Longimicrobiaceae bacterium]|nr:hypothetical protein [Longimicrobiaceae bacterium]